jgi:hypothetical protein
VPPPAPAEPAEAQTLPPAPKAGAAPPADKSRTHTQTLASDAASPEAADAPPPQIPGYEDLEELGRGGMGVVYKAYQRRLDRVVALKMILSHGHASPADLARFLAEGQAVAQMQHPHIVQIYEVGRHQDLPFFSLEYVAGGTLRRELQGTPWQPRAAAQLVETLARATHHAHQRGIIHRDLKPGNVLLTAERQPKITDFGLAKRPAADQELTATGAILGTPRYMAPEQAEGKKEITPAADVYALGAILYELLTGRPPFQGPTPLDTILQAASQEPVPPRQLQPRLPADLETICLKCLQKEPGRRYATADGLADDLAHFLAGRPITARPVGRLERAWRWCRRNPGVASLTAATAVLLAALVVGALTSAWWLRQERNTARTNEARARQEQERAEGAEVLLRDQLERTRQAEQARTDQLWQSDLDRARAGRASRQAGQRFDSLDAIAQAARIRPDPRLRDEAIACMALPDIRLTEGRAIRAPGTTAAAFDRNGRHYALGDAQGNVSIRRIADDREVARLPGPGKPAGSPQFSPEGRFLAVWYGEEDQRAWEVASGRAVLTGLPCRGISFSPDGGRLAVSRPEKAVSLFDLPSGRETARLHLPGDLWQAAFSPDGRRLACCGSLSAKTVVLDVGSGAIVAELSPGSDVYDAAWHPDGRRLALGCRDGRARVMDVATGRTLAIMEGHA